MQSLNEWKDNYLQHVGVPPNFPSDWDFISCVTACELPPLLIHHHLRLLRRNLEAVMFFQNHCNGWV